MDGPSSHACCAVLAPRGGGDGDGGLAVVILALLCFKPL